MHFERLADLRHDHDFSMRQVAARLGIHQEVYRRYERGMRNVPVDCLIKLAYLYDVSLEYLVGITNQTSSSADYPDTLYDADHVVVADRNIILSQDEK